MAQLSSLPSWVPLILGGGGLIGASTIIFNLFKQVTDAKDANIEALKLRLNNRDEFYQREMEFLKRNHQKEIDQLHRELEDKRKELAEVKDFEKMIEELIDGLKSQEITPGTKSSLKKIEERLADINRSRKILNSTRTAAEWLKHKMSDWVDQAVEEAANRYPDNMKNGKVKLFKADISNYLRWVYDSLHYGFFCRIEDYVRTPAIDSPFPYRAAFQELSEINDFGQLSEAEVQDLQDYIEELSRRALT